MSRYIAFLRAINVGGHIVKMEQLRALFEGMGFANVETFIASGNVIFETRSKDTSLVERKIESQLQKSLGYEVVTFIRTDREVEAISTYRAFSEQQIQSAAAFSVGFLAKPLEKVQRDALAAAQTEMDDFHYHSREVYWLSKVRQGESKFSLVALEKVLKARATFRGLKTIERLAAKYSVRGIE